MVAEKSEHGTMALSAPKAAWMYAYDMDWIFSRIFLLHTFFSQRAGYFSCIFLEHQPVRKSRR